MRKTPQCAVNAQRRMAELRKDKDLEALRPFMVEFDLFPRRRDPHTAPIRMEELKELVKVNLLHTLPTHTQAKEHSLLATPGHHSTPACINSSHFTNRQHT